MSKSKSSLRDKPYRNMSKSPGGAIRLENDLHKSERKTLTICVPTRDRANLLSTCLELIHPVLVMYSKEISLIIIDNASRDNTEAVTQAWIAENAHFDATYIRKESNTGAADSIIMGVESSKSDFFMFIGDDDALITKEVGRLLRVLKSHRDLGILVEADFGNEVDEVIIESLIEATNNRDRFKSGSAFYKFGNAWSGIYNVEAIKAILKTPRLREDLILSVWGQAELGFRATAELELRVGTLLFEYGYAHKSNPFSPGGLTSIVSATHLLTSSIKIASRYKSLQCLPSQLGTTFSSPTTQHLISILRRWPPNPSYEFILQFRKLRNLIIDTFSFKEATFLRFLCLLSYSNITIIALNNFLNLRLKRNSFLDDGNKNNHV